MRASERSRMHENDTSGAPPAIPPKMELTLKRDRQLKHVLRIKRTQMLNPGGTKHPQSGDDAATAMSKTPECGSSAAAAGDPACVSALGAAAVMEFAEHRWADGVGPVRTFAPRLIT